MTKDQILKAITETGRFIDNGPPNKHTREALEELASDGLIEKAADGSYVAKE